MYSLTKTKAECGKLGGLATFKKYGKEYMQTIGKRGYAAMRLKYDLVPYSIGDFAIVSKQTGKIVALLSGRKVSNE